MVVNLNIPNSIFKSNLTPCSLFRSDSVRTLHIFAIFSVLRWRKGVTPKMLSNRNSRRTVENVWGWISKFTRLQRIGMDYIKEPNIFWIGPWIFCSIVSRFVGSDMDDEYYLQNKHFEVDSLHSLINGTNFCWYSESLILVRVQSMLIHTSEWSREAPGVVDTSDTWESDQKTNDGSRISLFLYLRAAKAGQRW